MADSPAWCTIPPPGLSCSRTAGHEGPCAASPRSVEAPMDDDLDWWKKCPWRIGMHARVTSPDVLKEWRDRLGTVVGIMGHEVKLELEGDGRPMIWIRKSDVAPTTIESPPPAPAPGETRFRAALEEIVSGVYATGKNPRDIAYRVLRGAVPVQASPDDVCDCYDDGVGPVTGPKCKARGWCNGITGAPQRSASAQAVGRCDVCLAPLADHGRLDTERCLEEQRKRRMAPMTEPCHRLHAALGVMLARGASGDRLEEARNAYVDAAQYLGRASPPIDPSKVRGTRDEWVARAQREQVSGNEKESK